MGCGGAGELRIGAAALHGRRGSGPERLCAMVVGVQWCRPAARHGRRDGGPGWLCAARRVVHDAAETEAGAPVCRRFVRF